jgi:hypothetical protein
MVQIVDRIAFYGDKKFIGMPVHIFAFPIVIVKNMRGLEGENLGNSNHDAKIRF